MLASSNYVNIAAWSLNTVSPEFGDMSPEMLANTTFTDDLEMNSAYQNPSYHGYFEGNSEYLPWTSGAAQYPIYTHSSSAPQHYDSHSSNWLAAQDDPRTFGADGSDEVDWSNYGSLPTANSHAWAGHHHQEHNSANPSPTVDYFGAHAGDSERGLLPDTLWSSNDQPLYSPYSEVPPFPAQSSHRHHYARSTSAENGLAGAGVGASAVGLDFVLPPPKHSSSSEPSSPTATAAAPGYSKKSSLSASTKQQQRQQPKPHPIITNNKAAAKPKARRTSTATARSAPRSKASPAASTSTASAECTSSTTRKRKSQSPPAAVPEAVMSTILPANQDPRVASEEIRKEAWRICKAEALEMSQRRMLLIEHEKGLLEQETQKLQVNIEKMREAVAREHLELKEAVKRAARLSGEF
ncbi:hypothetical protein B0H63DRAFT_458154 [Podospora didyma]|uniref:Uncharacterized protein n=1 Tax=Podospora didyma TaxID=330526 RepID=A0AAE0U764_9PEZI|nr:hypothetical protein B0H63DRAFT_458154 [Podospora didyma]